MRQIAPAGLEQLQTRKSQPVAGDRDKASESKNFVDNRPETMAQRKLKDTIGSSPKIPVITYRNGIDG